MNKQQIESIFRWRKTLIENIESILSVTKSSKKLDLSSKGQLDLFSMGLEDVKSYPKLNEFTGCLDLKELVNIETELLGIPVLYEPLNYIDEMYYNLFCTHNVSDILELTDKTNNITIIDRLIRIEHRISQNGNKYCKLYFSQMNETYVYLWGQQYVDYIVKLFDQSIYLITLEFNVPTKEFDRYSYVCKDIVNIKDLNIESEYKRAYNSCNIKESNENWQLKNRNNVNKSTI